MVNLHRFMFVTRVLSIRKSYQKHKRLLQCLLSNKFTKYHKYLEKQISYRYTKTHNIFLKAKFLVFNCVIIQVQLSPRNYKNSI